LHRIAHILTHYFAVYHRKKEEKEEDCVKEISERWS